MANTTKKATSTKRAATSKTKAVSKSAQARLAKQESREAAEAAITKIVGAKKFEAITAALDSLGMVLLRNPHGVRGNYKKAVKS